MRKCKKCGEIEVKYLLSQKNICRVCDFKKENLKYKLLDSLSQSESDNILRNLLNGEYKNINDMSLQTNIQLDKCIGIVESVGSRKVKGSSKIEVNCNYCNKSKEITIYKYKHSESCFCNVTCKALYEGKIKRKKNMSDKNWENCKCEWCGKKFHRKESHINRNESNFCSKECKLEWFTNVYSMQDDVMERNRNIAFKNLKSGVFGVNSEAQVKVNKWLEELGIQYTNEFVVGFCSFDNRIGENLLIEVNGEYWHCDPRKYENIKYFVQRERIYRDKAKNIQANNEGYKILYLWEKDINEKEGMCKKLIEYFKDKNGMLENYESFNYDIVDKKLELVDKIKPYRLYSNEELQLLLCEHVKFRKEYYETLKCDYCGEGTKSLISQKNKFKKHFCSKECFYSFARQKGKEKIVHYKCDYCKSEQTMIEGRYKNSKNHFCSKECYDKFQVMDRTKVECRWCGKEKMLPKNKINSNKTGDFYCDKQCYKEHKRDSNWVKCKCDYCGKDMEITKYRFNQSSTHFCDRKCSNTYRNTGINKTKII